VGAFAVWGYYQRRRVSAGALEIIVLCAFGEMQKSRTPVRVRQRLRRYQALISELNRQFGINGGIVFAQRQGLVVARISTDAANAEIALQGAHVLSYRPAGQAPVFWLSDCANFETGKAIRGGVPICWPWFGERAGSIEGENYPQHGFARTCQWHVLSAAISDGVAVLEFELPMHGTELLSGTYRYFSSEYRHLNVRYEVRIGSSLTMKLTTVNHGDDPVSLSQALHSYFYVGEISDTELEGLDDHRYYDKTQQMREFRSSGTLKIDQEVDRIYLKPPTTVSIVDKALDRVIEVSSPTSASCVVWNPWAKKAQAMSDFSDHGFRSMLCVESTHARDDARIVEPGHSLDLIQNVAIRN